MTQAADNSAALEELTRWVGRESAHDGADEVSRNDIRRKLEVFCFDCPIHTNDEVARAHRYRMACAPSAMSPLWGLAAYWTPGEPSLYGPDRREKDGGAPLPISLPWANSVNAAGEMQYFEPLYPGDRLRTVQKLVDVKLRKTRLGEGAFLSFETTVSKRSGETVYVRRNSTFHYDKGSERAKDASTDDASNSEHRIDGNLSPDNDPVDWDHQLRFHEVALGAAIPTYALWLSYQRIVMSISVDRMFSPVHHNRDFAREGGLADIIFNTRGYEMLLEVTLRRWIGLDGRLVKVGPFRMVKNAHPGDTLVCGAQVTSVEATEGGGFVSLSFWVDSPRGRAAHGDVVVSVPA